CPLPRARSACRRFRAGAADQFHRAADRQDDPRAVRSVAAEMDRAMKSLRVLVLMDPTFMPPDSLKGFTAQEINEWKSEYHVVSSLRAAGHDVRPFAVEDELKAVRGEIEAFKLDVVFTLLEDFHGKVIYDQNVASFLELMQVPYTGCNPRGLILAR